MEKTGYLLYSHYLALGYQDAGYDSETDTLIVVEPGLRRNERIRNIKLFKNFAASGTGVILLSPIGEKGESGRGISTPDALLVPSMEKWEHEGCHGETIRNISTAIQRGTKQEIFI